MISILQKLIGQSLIQIQIGSHSQNICFSEGSYITINNICEVSNGISKSIIKCDNPKEVISLVTFLDLEVINVQIDAGGLVLKFSNAHSLKVVNDINDPCEQFVVYICGEILLAQGGTINFF